MRVYNVLCRAPADCVQYYSGSTQGYIQSYGFGSGQLLSSQNYKACIRQEEGYCGIDWHPSSRTNPSSFSMLSGDATGLLGVNAIGDCLDSYINIPDAMTYTSNNKYTELCGEAWAADGVAVSLGPLRCESAYLPSGSHFYLYHFQPTPHPSPWRSSPTMPPPRF